MVDNVDIVQVHVIMADNSLHTSTVTQQGSYMQLHFIEIGRVWDHLWCNKLTATRSAWLLPEVSMSCLPQL